jgi:hypothetical protein
MIGVAGWFDVFLWTPFYLVWIMLVGGLVFFGGLFGTWETRWRYLLILAGGVALPGVLQVSQANVTGFITGGRYMLPLLAGLPLLAAWTLERRLFDAGHTRSLTRAFVVLLLPVHLALLVFAMVRWQRGLPTHAGVGWFNPLAGDWHPPSGSVLPLVVMVIGLVATALLFLRVPREEPEEPEEPREPKEPGELGEPGETEPAAELVPEPPARERPGASIRIAFGYGGHVSDDPR